QGGLDARERRMKQQLFGIAFAAILQRKRAGRAGFAAKQSLGGELQSVVHPRHRPRLAAAIGERGELTTAATESAGSARVGSDLAALDHQAAQALEHFGRHARHAAGKADIVEAVLGWSGAGATA